MDKDWAATMPPQGLNGRAVAALERAGLETPALAIKALESNVGNSDGFLDGIDAMAAPLRTGLEGVAARQRHEPSPSVHLFVEKCMEDDQARAGLRMLAPGLIQVFHDHNKAAGQAKAVPA